MDGVLAVEVVIDWVDRARAPSLLDGAVDGREQPAVGGGGGNAGLYRLRLAWPVLEEYFLGLVAS